MYKEEQKKKRDRYFRAKECTKKKKVSERDRRTMRQKWRDQKRSYRLKNKTPEVPKSRQKQVWKKKNAAKRAKVYRDLELLSLSKLDLQGKYARYKQKYYRLKGQYNATSNSPRSKVHKFLKSQSQKVSPEVKRKLLFGETLKVELTESFQKGSFKRKQSFSVMFTARYLKKYKFMKEVKPFLSYHWRMNNKRNRLGKVGYLKRDNNTNEIVRKEVQSFYDSDEASCVVPGRKDYVTRDKICKQKRYLLNTLQKLHEKFCSKHTFAVSYSVFCRLRPYWVVFMKIHERNTCLCQKCANFTFITEKLKELKVIKFGDPEELIKKELCCPLYTNECIFRRCNVCVDKEVQIGLFDGATEVKYEKWVSQKSVIVSSKTGTKREVNHTVKEKFKCKLHELVSMFDNDLKKITQHVGTYYHQAGAMRALKKNLKDNEACVHIDFSENFECKYSAEVQGVHFGGSREQITLHTGVLYRKVAGRVEAHSFCTLSKSPWHDAIAILAHIYEALKNEINGIEIIHFQSDSPATQYRNKTMFYLIGHKFPTVFPEIDVITWNYTEAGHGKGAADGVGGTMKRTAHKLVSYSKDVNNFEAFCNLVIPEIPGIKIMVVPLDDIEKHNLSKEEKMSILPFVGTMKVHFLKWVRGKPNIIEFKSLTCSCDSKCKHFDLGLITYLFEKTDELVSNKEETNNQDAVESPTNSVTSELKEASLDDFVLVKFPYETKNMLKVKYYIGEITEAGEDPTIQFLQKSRQGSPFFTRPNAIDKSSVSKADIVDVLPHPITGRRSILQFQNYDFSGIEEFLFQFK